MLNGKYLDKFLSRIVHGGPGDCWEWAGAHISTGYAESWDGQRPVLAHRASYSHFVGPIPPGMTIDHLCNNPGCVNPEHLKVATQRENILRSNGTSAHNAVKTECKYGHPFDAANTHITPRGTRSCRACWKRLAKERAARSKS